MLHFLPHWWGLFTWQLGRHQWCQVCLNLININMHWSSVYWNLRVETEQTTFSVPARTCLNAQYSMSVQEYLKCIYLFICMYCSPEWHLYMSVMAISGSTGPAHTPSIIDAPPPSTLSVHTSYSVLQRTTLHTSHSSCRVPNTSVL